MYNRTALSALAVLVGATAGPQFTSAASLNDFNHIVVIYQENHSFDNLYGLWGEVNGEPVNGLPRADRAHTTQVRQDSTTPYACLLQNDVNLTSPPLPVTCTDNTGAPFQSAFTNRPFLIENYIASSDTTCPAPGEFAANGKLKGTGRPGGCTRDLVHRFYNEQYQINQGRQNRYVTGSDATGLPMGYYDTKKLPIYAYLHSPGAPQYVIADSFFQGSFGGSFLNHQWLIAGATPTFTSALNDGSANDFHSVVDANGMPTSTPLYASPLGAAAKDAPLTASCSPPPGRPATPPNVVCGDYAVNTIQPFFWPFSPGTPDARRLPPLTTPTIGDRLSAARVDWAWYAGGWSNANGDVNAPGWTNGNGTSCTDPNANTTTIWPRCPDKIFQFHHQPFNYYSNYGVGTVGRTHLRDEAEFIQAARNGTLKAVSFIKPIGEENEHPGYTNEGGGSMHLVNLIKAIVNGPNGNDTLIIVTYDEFGGSWDHVPPPPHQRRDRDDDRRRGDRDDDQGRGDRKPFHDVWGPGTRVPGLLIAKKFRHSGVDHADHDTTSILKLIEERFHLQPLGPRDAKVISLKTALETAESNR
jgi:phospholipase C